MLQLDIFKRISRVAKDDDIKILLVLLLYNYLCLFSEEGKGNHQSCKLFVLHISLYYLLIAIMAQHHFLTLFD